MGDDRQWCGWFVAGSGRRWRSRRAFQHRIEEPVFVLRVVPATNLIGKEVTVTFDVKTSLAEPGRCVLKLQRSPQVTWDASLGGDGKDLPAKSDKPLHCELKADVNPKTKWVLYGFSYRGAGTAELTGGTLTAN